MASAAGNTTSVCPVGAILTIVNQLSLCIAYPVYRQRSTGTHMNMLSTVV
jgi:hypothetical protein